MAECKLEQLEFHALGQRAVVGEFDGVIFSSDGGALQLREVRSRTRIIECLAEQFADYRDSQAIEHRVEALWSGSACSPKRWASRTFTTETACAWIRC